jgi:hypothetical protein
MVKMLQECIILHSTWIKGLLVVKVCFIAYGETLIHKLID